MTKQEVQKYAQQVVTQSKDFDEAFARFQVLSRQMVELDTEKGVVDAFSEAFEQACNTKFSA